MPSTNTIFSFEVRGTTFRQHYKARSSHRSAPPRKVDIGFNLTKIEVHFYG